MISAAKPLALVAFVTMGAAPVHAKPLDAESCAKLKLQRDALETAGVRSTMAAPPPARPIRTLDEKAQRIVALIQLDGQLRFRCNIEMPITSLKPELLVEVPDTVDGEPVTKTAPPKRPQAKRAKPAAPPDTGGGAVATGIPAPQRPKTAGAIAPPASPATPGDVAVVKPRPKPKPKSDDAFRAPAAKQESGTPPQ